MADSGEQSKRGNSFVDINEWTHVRDSEVSTDVSSSTAEILRGNDNPRIESQRKCTRFEFEKEVLNRPSDVEIGTEGHNVDLIANCVLLHTLHDDIDSTACQFISDWEPRLLATEAKRKILKSIAAAQEWGEYSFVSSSDSEYLILRKANDEGTDSNITKYNILVPRQNGSELSVNLTLTNVKFPFVKYSPEPFGLTEPHGLYMVNCIVEEIFRRRDLDQFLEDFYDSKRSATVTQTDGNGKVLSSWKIWPGYSIAVKPFGTDKLMLCIDTTHKMMSNVHFGFTLHEMLTHRTQKHVEKQVIGSIVYTSYDNRIWRVKSFTCDITIDDEIKTWFHKDNTESMSYRQYFEETHGMTLTAADQPLVEVEFHRSRNSRIDEDNGFSENKLIYLPSELCTLTGLTKKQQKDFTLIKEVMKELERYTEQTPQERFTELNDLTVNLKSEDEPAALLRSLNLRLDDSLLRLNGRRLSNIATSMYDTKLHSVSSVLPDRGAQWGQSLQNFGFNPKCSIRGWTALYPSMDEGVVTKFLSCLSQVAPGMNCEISPPETGAIDQLNAMKYVEEGRQRMEGKSFLLYFLPQNCTNVYNLIKRSFCVETPIITQCIMIKTIRNCKEGLIMSLAKKVLFQIACKLGCSPWVSQLPVELGTTMIVGLNTYPKRRRNSVRKSINAAVFSYNADHTQYYSSAAVDDIRIAVYNPQICGMFRDALQHYRSVNDQRLPDRLIIYKDGVEETDTYPCARQALEKNAIEKAVFKVYEKANYPPPNIILVLVNKHSATRLFRDNGNGHVDNPLPGTIVDSVITKPDICDFFLISQSQRQGTLSPTRYSKIYDNYQAIGKTSAFPASELQRLTYSLCHLYYNWPGAIRVPAPTHYAHRLASLIGENIGQVPDSSLCDRLFYL